MFAIYQYIPNIHADLSECFPRGRRVQTTTFVKNVEIVKVHDYIWNHNEKCIKLSTHAYSVVLVD